ncbi:MAG: type II secretion system minor pseudopilin GspH [Gammaproteobacteria bacterium]|jgi:general secretion pathway protein H
MPIRRQCTGFTLLELMVVLVLIGIIFSFAMLSLGGDDVAELMEQETRRLVTLLDMASDEAVMRGEELAVHFTDAGYSFMALRQDRWTELAGDRLLKPRVLPAGIALELEIEEEPPLLGESEEEEDDTPVPQVYILSSGEMTPFTMTLYSGQSVMRYYLTASVLGNLTWEAEEAL